MYFKDTVLRKLIYVCIIMNYVFLPGTFDTPEGKREKKIVKNMMAKKGKGCGITEKKKV